MMRTYEQINEKIKSGDVAVFTAEEAIEMCKEQGVITSYSIHYTKLYDFRFGQIQRQQKSAGQKTRNSAEYEQASGIHKIF